MYIIKKFNNILFFIWIKLKKFYTCICNINRLNHDIYANISKFTIICM